MNEQTTHGSTIPRRPRLGALALVAALSLTAAHRPHLQAQSPAAPELAGVELFDRVWEQFAATYPSFELKGVDWGAFRERHRPAFDEPLTAADFAARLAGALAELRDQHVWVQVPSGDFVPVYAPGFEQNFTTQPRNRYSLSGYRRLGEAVWHGWLLGQIGYIRIDTFERPAFEGVSEADVAALLAGYSGARGLIVDLRPNAGGDETIAAWFAGHFTAEPLLYGYVQFRDGDGIGPRMSKLLEPLPEPLIELPTAVLIGDRNMSSAEWFVLMMASCPQVVTVGDVTRGSSGNPEWLDLPNGVRVAVPRWIAYRPDGVPIEGHGIAPDLAVDPAASFDSSREYVIERALEHLGAL